jgi:release factor glutamine methyltransferase
MHLFYFWMMKSTQDIFEASKLLKKALSSLYQKGEADAIANLVLRHLTGLSQTRLLAAYTDKSFALPAEEFDRILTRLTTGEPVQYVLGETWFMDLQIKVDRSVLIPRQETEELVDLIVRMNPFLNPDVLDAGCGSGCIALAIKKLIPGASVTGVDISTEALALARKNAGVNRLDVRFVYSDMLMGLKEFDDHSLDILVSNPPYVTQRESGLMERVVLDFEPHTALFVPDDDPLLFYRSLSKEANRLLRKEGLIFFEINEQFGDEVLQLLLEAGFSNTHCLKDLNGKIRFVKGVKL